MAPGRCLRLLLLALPALAAVAEEGDDAVCAATGGCGGGRRHHWPTARGKPGSGTDSLAEFSLKTDLKEAFAWSWMKEWGRYTTTVSGHVVDDEKNIYLSALDGIRKFSGADGKLLWYYYVYNNAQVCGIMDGALFCQTQGVAYALDLKLGVEVWKSHLGLPEGGDTAYVIAHEGRVFLGSNRSTNPLMAGNTRMYALNATDGEKLWTYSPEDEGRAGLWNFMPIFPQGESSVVFMDWAGAVYKLAADTGRKLWIAEPPQAYKDSFTDGGVIAGPDGTLYACSNQGHGTPGEKGNLRAYRGSDGGLLWDKELRVPCTSWAAIHRDNGWGVVPVAPFLSVPVVMHFPHWPAWMQHALHAVSLALGSWMRRVPGFGWIPTVTQEVLAFDTKTGETLWSHRLPDWERLAAMGDEEGLGMRMALGEVRTMCLPAPMTCPTISADDTVWVGTVSGALFGVRHLGGGKVEERSFEMGASFLHGGTSWAPGQMAVATCDSLFVFHEK